MRKASFSSNATVAIFGFVKKVSAPAIWDSLSSLIVVATPATPHHSSSSKGDARSFCIPQPHVAAYLDPQLRHTAAAARRLGSTEPSLHL